jgi:hypothetical protein
MKLRWAGPPRPAEKCPECGEPVLGSQYAVCRRKGPFWGGAWDEVHAWCDAGISPVEWEIREFRRHIYVLNEWTPARGYHVSGGPGLMPPYDPAVDHAEDRYRGWDVPGGMPGALRRAMTACPARDLGQQDGPVPWLDTPHKFTCRYGCIHLGSPVPFGELPGPVARRIRASLGEPGEPAQSPSPAPGRRDRRVLGDVRRGPVT